MTIIRNQLDFGAGFVQIPNKYVRDSRLSYKARGLLAAILSHAEGFELREATLINQSPDGRDAIRTGLGELAKHGYLIRRQTRRPDGTVGPTEWETKDPDTPIAAGGTVDGLSGDGLSGDGLSDTKNTTTKNTTSFKNTISSLGGEVAQPQTAREEKPPPPKIAQQQTPPASAERPAAAATTGPPSPYCAEHPDGGDGAPCGACGDARRISQRWETEQADRQQQQQIKSREFAEWAKTRPDCPHGIAGGNIDRPAIGTPSCAACRSSITGLGTHSPAASRPPRDESKNGYQRASRTLAAHIDTSGARQIAADAPTDTRSPDHTTHTATRPTRHELIPA